MKHAKLFLVTAFFVAAAAAAFSAGTQDSGAGSAAGTGYGQGNGQGYGRGNGQGRGAGGGRGLNAQGLGGENDLLFREELGAVLAGIKPGTASATERATLLSMAEEEKLARDVYLKLYSVWNLPVFGNIAQSEQQHLDSLKDMMARYGIKDTVSGLSAGSYESEAMRDLYARLTARGAASLGAALEVGATIEDLDISDLQAAIAETDDDDLKITYQNLMKGSRNHLRSFVGQIDRQGVDYDPQYISREYFERILSLNREISVIDEPDYHL